MKTGEDGCVPEVPRRRVRVVGEGSPALRRGLEGLVAQSLEVRERTAADEGVTPKSKEFDAPAVREAFAFLMGFTMHAIVCCQDAEQALKKAKKRMYPDDVERVRRALRLAAAAASEARESIRSRTD